MSRLEKGRQAPLKSARSNEAGVTQGPGRQEGGPALLPSKQLACVRSIAVPRYATRATAARPVIRMITAA